MTASDEFDELWMLFEHDVERSLNEAETALLALNRKPVDDAAEQLNQLYRGLHSIKGNARAMGLPATEQFTHQAEDLVALCRDGTTAMADEVLDTILEAVDRLRAALLDAVAARRDIRIADEPDLLALQDKLRELVQLYDIAGDRDAATDEDFVLFDDFDDDSDSTDAEAGAPSIRPSTDLSRPAESAQFGDAEKLVFVQVKASRVRELLALASDLGLSADVLMTDPDVRQAAKTSETLGEKIHRLRRLTRDLRFASGALALVPVADLFTRIRRVARDLARQTGKTFDLVIDGEATEIDRFLIDQLYDPLMHIMRNAVDHGLEGPAARAERGKPAQGCVVISASNAGQGIVLQISDDGAGLDRTAIVDKAKRKGLVPQDVDVDDDDALRLILTPGFSTREVVSNLSGRGVGLDVVHQAVQRLRGSLNIESKLGQGTTFKIQLPMTLAFADVLLVVIAERSYAIPLEYIRRVVTPSAQQYIRSSASREEHIRLEDGSIPLLRLDNAFTQAPDTVVAVRTSRGDFGLPVAHILGTEQVTLRPLSSLLSGIRGASACGLMANGEIAVTLDCEKLVNDVAS